jgi:4Fe-4S ferredoxin
MENESVINTHGVQMPKHIVSGLKYLTAVELIREGLSQKEVAKILEMDRSTVSHYLNGRNLSWNSIEVAEIITKFCPKDFLTLTYALIEDSEKTRIIVKTCSKKSYKATIEESCIGCGLCVDTCLLNAIVLDDLKARIDSDWCNGCNMCRDVCPTDSIKILEVNNGY